MTHPIPKRKTIGVFVPDGSGSSGGEFLAGVNAAAGEYDVNLVYLIGTKPGSISAAEQSQPSFGVYDPAALDQFDGFILTTEVSNGAIATESKRLAEAFPGIPIASQAEISSPNNAEGMRMAVRHLITEHGCKQLAFIRGTRGQTDAEQRFQAYQDELQAQHLVFQEELVVEGNDTSESAKAALLVLLEERQLPFQAVVVSNEEMALGALEAVQQHGLRVPEDVAVIALGDLHEVQFSDVPFTTVRPSLHTAGKRAVELLITRLPGNSVAALSPVRTRLIKGWSCGCLADELSRRIAEYRSRIREQQDRSWKAFSLAMASALSLEQVRRVISEHFPNMGIERAYILFRSDETPFPSAPASGYTLLLQVENAGAEIPQKRIPIAAGQLLPAGKIPEDRRYTALVLPLPGADKHFGLMWMEMGPRDWETYVRVGDLLSGALLHVMLVQQKEQAQIEVERLLEEARERTAEVKIAKEFAEKTAAENARLFSSEQARRNAAEALTQSARQLSSLGTVTDVHQQIVTQLASLIPNDHCAIFLEDMNGLPRLFAHAGFPVNAPVEDLAYTVRGTNVYHLIARQSEPLVIGDVETMQSWQQPGWAPQDRSWLGIPLYSKNKVIGMLSLSRSAPVSFTQDDVLLANTFAIQASVALENARLYDDLNRFNQMMERMVEQRVDELNGAYRTLEKLDKNKSDFIQVAAHELRTPLTVIKGLMGMIKAAPAVQKDASLAEVTEGILRGTNRLHLIVNSMLDVARLENQVITTHPESLHLGPIVRLICQEYAEDLRERQMRIELDPDIDSAPALLADSELLKKALDNIVVNAIKFTPDGGSIFISAHLVRTDGTGEFCEIRVRDTGIGIDPANHTLVFEKLYQLGKVELHSSGRTKFKGGGPGLGLAIAAGIVKAHKGKIWVESPGYDEEKMPGSTFILQIPVAK